MGYSTFLNHGRGNLAACKQLSVQAHQDVLLLQSLTTVYGHLSRLVVRVLSSYYSGLILYSGLLIKVAFGRPLFSFLASMSGSTIHSYIEKILDEMRWRYWFLLFLLNVSEYWFEFRECSCFLFSMSPLFLWYICLFFDWFIFRFLSINYSVVFHIFFILIVETWMSSLFCKRIAGLLF